MKSKLVPIIIAAAMLVNIPCAQSEAIELSPNLNRIVLTLKKSNNPREKLILTQKLMSQDIGAKTPLDISFLRSFRNSYDFFVRYWSQGYTIEKDSVYCMDFSFTTADFNQDGREEIQGTYIFADNNLRYGVAASSHLSSQGRTALHIDTVFAKDVNLDGKVELISIWRNAAGKRYVTIHKTFEAILYESGYIEFGSEGEIYLSPSRTPNDTYILTIDGGYMSEKQLNEILRHKQHAFDLFSQGDYANAVQEFEKAFSIRSSRDTLIYYLALCQMKSGKLQDAKYRFHELAQVPQSPFRDSAFYYFLELLPQETAHYDIRFVDTIPESLTSIKPQTYLCSSDFDGDKKPDLFFGGDGLSIYLSSGKILTSAQKNFSPYWVEVTKKEVTTVSRMKYTLFHVGLKEDKGELVLTDTIRMTGLPDVFLSYYGVHNVDRFGNARTDPLIIIDNGPGPPKPNKTFLVSEPIGNILTEIDMNMKASSFALSSKKNTFYIGSYGDPKEMMQGILPCIVKFNIRNNHVLIDTIFDFPREPIPPGHNWYGAGYAKIIETDLENDGKLDLILQEYDYAEDSEHSYYLRVISENPVRWKELWNGRFFFSGKQTIVADVDQDRIQEIFTDNNTGYCKDHVPHIMVIRKSEDSWIQEKLLFPNCYLLDSGDFDNDGSEEVMIMRGPSWQEKNYTLWLVDRRTQ